MMRLEPIGDTIVVIPEARPERTKGGIWIPTSFGVKCIACRGTGQVANEEMLSTRLMTMQEFWTEKLRNRHASECPRCGGSGKQSFDRDRERKNMIGEVVAVGPGLRNKRGIIKPILAKPGDTVVVAYWSGVTASGSRSLYRPRYGLPEGTIVCHEFEVFARWAPALVQAAA